MQLTRLDYKILGPVALILIVGFGAFSLLLWRQEQADTLHAAEEFSHVLAAAVAKSVQNLMLQGRADIARQFIEDCRTLPGIEEIDIYRRDGTPAFYDLRTLRAVEEYRQRLGMEGGLPVIRQGIESFRWQQRSLPPPMTRPEFFAAVRNEQAVSFRETHNGHERLTHLKPLRNEERCYECHEPTHRVRGVVKVSTSLEPLRQAAVKKTLRYGVVFCVTTFIVVGSLAVFLRKAILRPIDLMARQVRHIAQGDLSQRVTVQTQDEMGELAAHLNRMTESLKTYQEQLIRTEKLSSLGTLASGFAHELNNPLASIAGYAEDLLDTLSTPAFVNGTDQQERIRHALEVILKQADRCRDIIQHLLKFARKEEFQRETVFLASLLEEVVVLLEPQARQRGVRLTYCVAPDVPPLWSDAASLQQVFFNLIKNGIEAVPAGGEVHTAASRVGEWVEVTVTDTGAGIPAEWEHKVFDLFFTTKPPGQGTGLGLPISCMIIEGLGGKIRFTSQVGRGTTFTVRLPIQHAEYADDTEKTTGPYR